MGRSYARNMQRLVELYREAMRQPNLWCLPILSVRNLPVAAQASNQLRTLGCRNWDTSAQIRTAPNGQHRSVRFPGVAAIASGRWLSLPLPSSSQVRGDMAS